MGRKRLMPVGASEAREGAKDFPTLEAAARAVHATHVWTDVDNGTSWLFWKDRAGVVTKSELFRADGKYHVSGRWFPASLPKGSRPLAGEDYVAIGSSGKIVGGPFKYYEHAKKEADKQGGYVRFAMEIVADYEAIDSRGKRIAGPFKHYDQAKKEADARGGLVRYAFESPIDALATGLSAISQLRKAPSQMSTEGAAEPASKSEIQWATWRARAAVTYTYGAVSSVKLLEVTGNDPHNRGFRFSARAVARGPELIVHVVGTGDTKTRVINPKTGVEKIHVSEKGRRGSKAAETAPIVHDKPATTVHVRPGKGSPPPIVPYIHCTRNEDQYRAALAAGKKVGAVRTAADVYRVMWPVLGKEDQEVFGVLLFDVRNVCIGWHECARGPRDHVEVPMGQVFAPVVQYKPHHYLVVHNHPTGTSDPSKSDLDLTDRIVRGAEPWSNDSSFVDHVILGVDECYSIGHKKKFKIAPPPSPRTRVSRPAKKR